MAASRILASCLFWMAAGMCAVAQDANLAPAQPSTQSPEPQSSEPSSSEPSSQPQSSGPSRKESSSRPVHHIRVPIEDSQPPELTEAEAAIEKKDYAAAEPLLRKLVAHDSTNYVAWFDLGFVENGLGKLEESIAAYRKSVAAKPTVFESNLNLGLQLAKSGQPDAEDFLRAATRLQPTGQVNESRYRAWIALGQIIEKTKPKEALVAYDEAANLLPVEGEPHLYSGELLEQQSKFGDAEQEYKQALALDATLSDAVIGLANIYMRARRFPEAEEYLRKLVTQHADSAAVHIQLGRVLAAEGKSQEAIDEVQAGIKIAPGNDAAQRDLADLYVSAGKNEMAAAAYRGLLTSHPNDAELHRRLGEALLVEKQFPEAQQEFTTAVKLKPNLGEAYGGLAFAAGENKNYALTIRALDARAKLLPEVAITYFMRASAYDHLRDYKNAAANYRLFLNSAQGKYPDQEWQAKHRLLAIEPKK